jgi:Flp pilus assembly protein TadB
MTGSGFSGKRDEGHRQEHLKGVRKKQNLVRGGESTMSIHVNLSAIAALIAGILILIMPKLLNYIVAIYLIVIGILGLSRLV